MKNIQNIVLFSMFLIVVCGATSVMAIDKGQKKQQQLKTTKVHGSKKKSYDKGKKETNSEKNLRLFNIFKADLMRVAPRSHAVKSKRAAKSQVNRKKFQASAERNQIIFGHLLSQANDKLHDDNKRADQNYTEKANWKMKEALKEQHLRLKK